MKILKNKDYEDLLEYKKWHDNMLSHMNKEERTARLFKVDCCDFCFNEYMNYKRSKTEILQADYFFLLHNKTIRICKKHIIDLRDGCQKAIVEDITINEN